MVMKRWQTTATTITTAIRRPIPMPARSVILHARSRSSCIPPADSP
jgi:hypothetical protein